MTISKTYKVAQHIFRLEMEEDSPMWKRAEESYGPFEIHDTDISCLFSISICNGTDKPETFELVYSNKGNAEPGFMELSVYKGDTGHYFEFTQPGSDKANGQLLINGDLSEARLSLNGSGIEQWLTFNTGINFCYLLATACHDTVLTHASCVIYEGHAYLFLGKSGTGKSTHSRMWQSALDNVTLLNDDHPVVRLREDGKAIAYGSPWSGKTRCYKNISAPVGGIVRIKRAPRNKAYRLSPLESYASLMTSCSGMTWEKELADGKDRTIQGIISSVPCWAMECLPDEDAAKICSETVTGIVQ